MYIINNSRTLLRGRCAGDWIRDSGRSCSSRMTDVSSTLHSIAHQPKNRRHHCIAGRGGGPLATEGTSQGLPSPGSARQYQPNWRSTGVTFFGRDILLRLPLFPANVWIPFAHKHAGIRIATRNNLSRTLFFYYVYNV